MSSHSWRIVFHLLKHSAGDKLFPQAARQLSSQTVEETVPLGSARTNINECLTLQPKCSVFFFKPFMLYQGNIKNHVGDLYYSTRISAKKIISSDSNRLKKAKDALVSITVFRWWVSSEGKCSVCVAWHAGLDLWKLELRCPGPAVDSHSPPGLQPGRSLGAVNVGVQPLSLSKQFYCMPRHFL